MSCVFFICQDCDRYIPRFHFYDSPSLRNSFTERLHFPRKLSSFSFHPYPFGTGFQLQLQPFNSMSVTVPYQKVTLAEASEPGQQSHKIKSLSPSIIVQIRDPEKNLAWSEATRRRAWQILPAARKIYFPNLSRSPK